MLESETSRLDAKMELSRLNSVLVPNGVPNYLLTVKFKPIGQQVEKYGKQTIVKSLFLMIKDFCGTFNVVRNMSDDQMIDCALMLLDMHIESNYRIEDFTQFFQVAKAGKYGKVYDHVDTPVIMEMLDRFHEERCKAGNDAMDEIFNETDKNFEKYFERNKQNEEMKALTIFAGGLSAARNTLKNNEDKINEEND